MHSFPLSASDSLNKYLDDHVGFPHKTDLIAAALSHFRACIYSKYRDVSKEQHDRATHRSGSFVQRTRSDFADFPEMNVEQLQALLEDIAIIFGGLDDRWVHEHGAAHSSLFWVQMQMIADRIGVVLHDDDPLLEELRSSAL
jgi:hypothetical protein